MISKKSYFFCGIGGSGMLPLACIVRAQGHEVMGSDRSLDQGRTAAKFDFLKARGISLFPQDGSGIIRSDQILVTSAAVEDTIPDVVRARALGLIELRRANLLADLFNAAKISIGVAGTSGKSTVTGMIGWILDQCGRAPTVMNGAVMKNFITPDTPFASALVGDGNIFVSEVDESDGSIALYAPYIAVLNNISLDHKSMDELRALFRDFIGKAHHAILNLDNEEVATLAPSLSATRLWTYGLDHPGADIQANNITPLQDGIVFTLVEGEERITIRLGVPGRHNISNALAAIAAARACGITLADAAHAISGFTGLKRRMDVIGSAAGITVIDDFGHNPDKIAATLSTLHAFPGRLLIFFQPHGYGPLRVMKDELIHCLINQMGDIDEIIMSDPVYYGGTTDRSIGSADIVAGVTAAGKQAHYIADRAACGDWLSTHAQSGDRIIIMGARDDSLSLFAQDILTSLQQR